MLLLQKILATSVLYAAIQMAAPAAADVMISSASDLDATGLGDYSPIGGTNLKSAVGQIDVLLLTWQNSGSSATESLDVSLDTVGEFLALVPGTNPVVGLEFALGVIQSDDSLAGAITMTQLDVSIGGTGFSFGGAGNLIVAAHGTGGSQGEAIITLDLGLNLRSLDPATSFNITSTIADRTGGPERLYLSNVAVPEPSAFAFFSLVGGVSMGLRKRRRVEV